MLATIEVLQQEDSAEASDLIDRCMRAEAELSMTEDFPLLVGPTSRARRTIVRDENGIQSHVAVRVTACQAPSGALFNICNIGAVCTDPKARGLGYAGQLIEEQLNFATDQGVELAMLWAEVEGYYERFGFHYAGVESRFLVSSADVQASPLLMARWANLDDVAALRKLRSADPCPISRSYVEAQVLFNLPMSKTLLGLEGQEVVAYLTIGKGLDFQDAVCEWGGDVGHVMSLLKTVMEQERKEAVLILGPSWHNDYFRSFMNLGCPHEAGDLAMFRVLNPACFRRVIDPNERMALPADPKNLLFTALGQMDAPTIPPALPFYVWGLDSM